MDHQGSKLGLLDFFVSGCILAGGLVFFFLAQDITEYLSVSVLPKAMTVRSGGTYFPPFADANGFTHQLRWGGLLLALLGAGLAISSVLPVKRLYSMLMNLSSRRMGWLLAGLLLATFAVYLYVAYPPNFYPSNSYSHWLRNRWESRWIGLYPAIQLMHHMFYEFPSLLTSLLGVANTFLVFVSTRRLLDSRLLGLLAATGFAFSGNVMLFADTAEGVMVCHNLLLLVVLVYGWRSRYLVGVVIFMATLGRPQFVALVPAFLCAEFALRDFLSSSEARLLPHLLLKQAWVRARTVLMDRFVLTNLLSFSLLYAVWQVITYTQGANLFLHLGHNINLEGNPFTATSRTIVGVQYPFSGAHLLHALWIFPVSVVLCNLALPLCLRSFRPQVRAMAVFILSFSIINFIYHESVVAYGFNVRHISYYYPILYVNAWLVIPFVLSHSRKYGALFVLLLVFSPATVFNQSFPVRERILSRPEHELLQYRYELRKWRQGRTVYTDGISKYSRNYLAYILKMKRGYILGTRDSSKIVGSALYLSVAGDTKACSEVLISTERTKVCLIDISFNQSVG